MAGEPVWYRQLQWSSPVSVEQLNAGKNRDTIPCFPGCYAITAYFKQLRPGFVLYVGQASTSLRQRLPAYLIDYKHGKAPKQEHKGRAFVLAARKRYGDDQVHVRWVVFGGGPDDLNMLEASLIWYLRAQANDRDEEARHGSLSDWERIDPRFLLPDDKIPTWMLK